MTTKYHSFSCRFPGIQTVLFGVFGLSPLWVMAEDASMNSLLGIGEVDTYFKSYRPSYFGLRVSHSNEAYEGEAKFQLSLKYQLTNNKVYENSPVANVSLSNWYVGYTQKSFWSIQDASQPFRENNFSPELFKEFHYAAMESEDLFKFLRFGLYAHESTGEAGIGSHGWNITYIEPVWKYMAITFAPKLWVPVMFRQEKNAAPDNPDIFDYYGNGEIKLIYDQSERLRHSLMYRQGQKSEVYGAQWQTDYVLKLGAFNPKVFVQFWSGYGESLKDYNNNTHGMVAGLSAVY